METEKFLPLTLRVQGTDEKETSIAVFEACRIIATILESWKSSRLRPEWYEATIWNENYKFGIKREWNQWECGQSSRKYWKSRQWSGKTRGIKS